MVMVKHPSIVKRPDANRAHRPRLKGHSTCRMTTVGCLFLSQIEGERDAGVLTPADRPLRKPSATRERTDRMQPKQRRRLTFLAGFAAYFVVLWLLWPTVWIYPLKIFVVFLHELSHAIAGLATGGTVQRITLDPYQGGATYVNGGNALVMLSAGYLGSLLWGLGLLLVARMRVRTSRNALVLLGALMLGTSLLFVRNIFGFLFGLLFGAALVFAARKLPSDGVQVVLTALGLTSALYSLFDIRDDILKHPQLQSDAFMLGQLTGVNTLVWGFLWAGIALTACFWVGRQLYQRA
jgi:hypothetical protein